LAGLIEQLCALPGIGEKSAQRLAFHLISKSKEDISQFAEVLTQTRNSIQYCRTCFNIATQPLCYICCDEMRQKNILCIVSEPQDIVAIEKSQSYKGAYHVLGGLISPLDGVHPEALRIQELLERLKSSEVQEVILAINSTVEGDSTILYLESILNSLDIQLTKLAYGLPMGADIEYIDELTLQKAIHGRVLI